jgi:hypothetical protein
LSIPNPLSARAGNLPPRNAAPRRNLPKPFRRLPRNHMIERYVVPALAGAAPERPKGSPREHSALGRAVAETESGVARPSPNLRAFFWSAARNAAFTFAATATKISGGPSAARP